MNKLVLAVIIVLVIIYAVPFLVYTPFSIAFGLEPPEGVSPLVFMLSVLLMKLGTAIGFVLIFYIARRSLSGQWFLYASLWWIMFAIVECGMALGPNYGWMEAIAGIISEAIYFPLAALATERLIGIKPQGLT
jgi:hypothetical protein